MRFEYFCALFLRNKDKAKHDVSKGLYGLLTGSTIQV